MIVLHNYVVFVTQKPREEVALKTPPNLPAEPACFQAALPLTPQLQAGQAAVLPAKWGWRRGTGLVLPLASYHCSFLLVSKKHSLASPCGLNYIGTNFYDGIDRIAFNVPCHVSTYQDKPCLYHPPPCNPHTQGLRRIWP